MRPLFHFLRLLVVAFAILPARDAAAQIYADVQVGGAVSGTFTIALENTKAPSTVANFIGLATGQRGWLDRLTGEIRRDGFYNGVTFHRVIAGFVSQAGSRAGDGTDGPGYAVRDEIDASLHHDPYVVAMANSGKNTNGSQFYITSGAQTFLDGGYTIFGRVTAGQSVCDQINATPTNSTTNKPLTAITIQAVNIYGPSLATFDLNPARLPKLSNAMPALGKSGSVFSLDYQRRAFSEYLAFDSANLTAWTRFASGYFGKVAPTGNIDVTSSAVGSQHYYRVARGDYATCATADIAGNTFGFSGPLNGVAALNATKTAGTWTFNGGGSYAITTASFTPQPYTAQIYLQLSNNFQFLLTLQYNSTTAGSYSGQTNVIGYENVSGTFTVGP